MYNVIFAPNGANGLLRREEGVAVPETFYTYGTAVEKAQGLCNFVGEPSTFGCTFSFVRFVQEDAGAYAASTTWAHRWQDVAVGGLFEVRVRQAVDAVRKTIQSMIRIDQEAEFRATTEDERVSKRFTSADAYSLLNVPASMVEVLQTSELVAISDEGFVLRKIRKIATLSVGQIREFVRKYNTQECILTDIVVEKTPYQSKKAPQQVLSDEYMEFKSNLEIENNFEDSWDEASQEAEPSLAVLGAAHATHALASGLSGEITTIAGDKVVIKGSTRVTKVVTGQIEDEKIEQIQVSFNMNARRLIQEGREFVQQNLPQILGLLQSKKPAYKEEDVEDEILRKIASKARIELPGQVTKTLGILEGLKKNPFVLYNGAPGIGKTHVSVSVLELYVQHLYGKITGKALFQADGAKHLRKMEREFRATLGNNVLIRIINTKEDIDQAAQESIVDGKIIVYIVSKDTAKRTTSWTTVPNLKSCPNCGALFTKAAAEKRACGRNPEDQRPYASSNTGSCGACGEKLIMPNSKNATTGAFKWGSDRIALPSRSKLNGFGAVESLSGYIVRKYGKNKIFDLFIVDEAHNMSAEESSQGNAMKEFIQVSSKVLLLTGTLTNGYPSSVFYLLSAVMPKRLREWGFNPSTRGVNKWIDSYGARKTVARRSRSGIVKAASEKPVISPQMVMHHLAPFTVWGKLEDLNYPMPKYVESVITTQVEPEILQAAERAQNEAFHIFTESMSTRSRSSAITKAMLYMGNNPTKPYNIDIVDKGEVLGEITIPALFDESYTTFKEQALIEEIIASIESGRKLMVYTFFNVSADTANRLEKVLKRELPNLAIAQLPQSIKAAKLEEWFEAAGNKYQVVIVPYKRVATGLDIPQFPDVRFYEEEYNIRDIMQAAKRPYRAVIQKQDVVVKHIVQEGIQATAMDLIAKKMTASKIVEGETYSEDGIESFAMDSIELELQKKLAEGVAALVKPDFATTEIAAGRSRPWTKLERRYLEIVKEINPAALAVIAPEEDDGFVDTDESEIIEETQQGFVEIFEDASIDIMVEEIISNEPIVAFDEIEAINCTTLEPVRFIGVVMKSRNGKAKVVRHLEGDTEAMKADLKVGEKIQLAFF